MRSLFYPVDLTLAGWTDTTLRRKVLYRTPPTPDSRKESNAEQSAPPKGNAVAQRMTKNELLAELIARDAELARLKSDLASRDARIDELFELLADSHNNDVTRSHRREMTAETQPTMVTQQTQQTQQSDRSEGEGGKRSGKLQRRGEPR